MKRPSIKRRRNTRTGRWASAAQTAAHPNSTVTETVPLWHETVEGALRKPGDSFGLFAPGEIDDQAVVIMVCRIDARQYPDAQTGRRVPSMLWVQAKP